MVSRAEKRHWTPRGRFVGGVGSFSYLGRKTAFIDRYPAPRFPLIIEPFAGSASYSVRWHQHAASLFDVDSDVATVWRWILGGCDPKDLEAIELHRRFSLKSTVPTSFSSSDDITRARNKAERLAREVAGRWIFDQASYTEAPDVEATWFVDPPYAMSSDQYAADAIDYAVLWDWVRSRKGQVILCEAADNGWIPEPVEVVTTIASGLAGGKGRSTR